MMINLNEKSLFTFLLLAFVAVVFFLTLGLGRIARLVPLVVAVPTLGLLAIQSILDVMPRLAGKSGAFDKKDVFGVRPLLEKRQVRVDREPAGTRRRSRELTTVLWLSLMFALIYLCGFVVALPTYTFLYLKRRSGAGWRTSAAVAAGMVALLYGVFVFVLPVRMYEGLLWNWLAR